MARRRAQRRNPHRTLRPSPCRATLPPCAPRRRRRAETSARVRARARLARFVVAYRAVRSAAGRPRHVARRSALDEQQRRLALSPFLAYHLSQCADPSCMGKSALPQTMHLVLISSACGLGQSSRSIGGVADHPVFTAPFSMLSALPCTRLNETLRRAPRKDILPIHNHRRNGFSCRQKHLATALPLRTKRAHAFLMAEPMTLDDDLETLWSLPCSSEGCLLGETVRADSTRLGVLVSKDSTITKLWNLHDWEQHTSSNRMWRHLFFWPKSTILRRLYPMLLVLGAWSLLVLRFRICLPAAAVAYSVSPLALLLAFRVNAASARFGEARAQWGRAIFAARELAANIAVVESIPSSAKEGCARAICCFGWAMKASLRGVADLELVINSLLAPEAAKWVMTQKKPPLALLMLVRKWLVQHPIPLAPAQAISSCIADLNLCYGGMERILSTPLSPTYGRHTSRGLMLWLAMLPCALVASGVSNIFSLLTAQLSITYIMLGIDEIGIQIEQPFDVLPLYGMATVLTRDVQQAFAADVPLTPGL